MSVIVATIAQYYVNNMYYAGQTYKGLHTTIDLYLSKVCFVPFFKMYTFVLSKKLQDCGSGSTSGSQPNFWWLAKKVWIFPPDQLATLLVRLAQIKPSPVCHLQLISECICKENKMLISSHDHVNDVTSCSITSLLVLGGS